jgi:hypothetical protein
VATKPQVTRATVWRSVEARKAMVSGYLDLEPVPVAVVMVVSPSELLVMPGATSSPAGREELLAEVIGGC